MASKKQRKADPPADEGDSHKARKAPPRPTGYRNPFLIESREWTLIGDVLSSYYVEYAHHRPDTRYHVEEAIHHFMKAAGLHENLPMVKITKERCKTWKSALLTGTAHANRRKPKAVTIARKMQLVAHWLKWSVANDYLDRNPMEGLAIPARLIASQKITKTAFTATQLEMVMRAMLNFRDKGLLRTETGEERRTEFFWIVMLLAFTGARRGEVLQLLRSDIREVEGIWSMVVEPGPGKKLKTAISQRAIPLHSQLLGLGFLEWWKSNKAKSLFHTGQTKDVSSWFSRLLTSLDMKTQAVSLHSLRHTMAVNLERKRVHPSVRHRLLGHALGTSTEDRIYLASLEYSVKELQEGLELVRIPGLG